MFRRLATLVCVLMLGSVLGGCWARCVDWPWNRPGPQSCADTAPRP